jgi:hypothetical protein
MTWMNAYQLLRYLNSSLLRFLEKMSENGFSTWKWMNQKTIVYFVSSHMFGYVEQKLLGSNREKVCFFWNLIFSAVRNFKFRRMFCRNKKFCSVKLKIMFSCTFAGIQIWDNIGSLLFISLVISMNLSGYYFFMPIYGCAKFHWKISKNKICHFWQAPLAATRPLDWTANRTLVPRKYDKLKRGINISSISSLNGHQ